MDERRDLIERCAAALDERLRFMGVANTRVPGTENVDAKVAAETVLVAAGILPPENREQYPET